MSALAAEVWPEEEATLPESMKEGLTRDEIVDFVARQDRPVTVRDILDEMAKQSDQPTTKVATELRAALDRGLLALDADLNVSRAGG